MVVCNACRYCEGFCAVFPAMERRRRFADGDLTYLANLCFDCRACFYACQYAPPHEFAVNVPKVFAQLRADTYRDYGWPRILAGLYRRGGLAGGVIGAAGGGALLLPIFLLQGAALVLSPPFPPGAFYPPGAYPP